MINKIEKLLQEARTHVAVEVNNTLLRTYKEIGKLLVEDIDLHENEENSRMPWHSCCEAISDGGLSPPLILVCFSPSIKVRVIHILI